MADHSPTQAEVIASYKVRLAAAHSKLDKIATELLESVRAKQLQEVRRKITHR